MKLLFAKILVWSIPVAVLLGITYYASDEDLILTLKMCGGMLLFVGLIVGWIWAKETAYPSQDDFDV